MIKAVFAFLFVVGFLLAAPTQAISSSIEQKHEQMLYPTVLVSLEGGAGSGTVIFSGKRKGSWVSLVLTNFHVIENNVSVEKEWNSLKEKKVDVETRRPVQVSLWEYNNYSDSIGTMGRLADIVAYDKKRDLALLQITDKERQMPYVAKLYPENKDSGPWIFNEVFAVGAGLGKPPFPTRGVLAGAAKDSNGLSLWLATAPIIFGNSGGSLFVYSHRKQYELIGVPSMVSVYGWAVVPHMAWARPVSEIRFFLRKNKFGYILGDKEEKKVNGD
jgi:S1-C subfamily serine protease